MPSCAKRIVLSIAALALLVTANADAEQNEPAQYLVRARTHWQDLEYKRVVDDADRALALVSISDKDRLEALRLKGSALAVLDKGPDATAVFIALLEIDARYRLPPDTSPRIRSIFDPTRSRWLVRKEAELRDRLGEDLFKLKMNVSIPRQSKGGKPLAVQISLVDAKRLTSELLVHHRKRGARTYSTVSVPAKAGDASIAIPGLFTQSPAGYQLEVYVEGLHESGIALRRHGLEQKPVVVVVSAGAVPRTPPIHKRWWFWAGAAAVAVTLPLLIDQAIDVGPQTISGARRP